MDKDRCLPPPLPPLQTEDGLTCRANDANAGFPSLFLQILLGNDIIPPGMKKHYAKEEMEAPTARQAATQHTIKEEEVDMCTDRNDRGSCHTHCIQPE